MTSNTHTHTQVSKLEENVRQVERRLKQSLSEQEHLTEHNAFLTGEIDRCLQFNLRY